MKKFFSLLVLSFLVSNLFAQENYTRRPGVGVSITLTDFTTAAELRRDGLSTVFKNHQFFKKARLTPGATVDYYDGLSKHLDFKGSVGGYFANYPIPDRAVFSGKPFVLEATASVIGKLLSDRHHVTPYLGFGVGGSLVQGNFAAFIPASFGFQVNFSRQFYLAIGTSYRIPVTDMAAYHFQHNLSLSETINMAKPVPPKEVVIPVVEPPKDIDGDGVIDIDDECPSVPGPASLKGCPDKDGDGIADKNDNCPDVPGTAKYQGCPIPDTDKDGINDEEDRCVNVPGVARYNGCPIPDDDGDGVNNEEDKCPTIAGPASNSGCPVIEEAIIQRVNLAAKNIFFATGSAKLLAKSFPKLDDVVKIMTDDKSLMLDIEGHTDITGTKEKNQVLSENRANSVKSYFISKGIEADRLTSTGYGIDKPIADNKTAAGRAKNRRVEMKLRNY